MLWDELRWCRCWIITPRRGIANTCRGEVREGGFLGLKASMPRTEELSGRKYAAVWIRSAIIRSRAGPGPPVNPCDVNEEWHDNDITHSYSLTESRGEMQRNMAENNEKARWRNNDHSWCSKRTDFKSVFMAGRRTGGVSCYRCCIFVFYDGHHSAINSCNVLVGRPATLQAWPPPVFVQDLAQVHRSSGRRVEKLSIITT